MLPSCRWVDQRAAAVERAGAAALRLSGQLAGARRVAHVHVWSCDAAIRDVAWRGGHRAPGASRCPVCKASSVVRQLVLTTVLHRAADAHHALPGQLSGLHHADHALHSYRSAAQPYFLHTPACSDSCPPAAANQHRNALRRVFDMALASMQGFASRLIRQRRPLHFSAHLSSMPSPGAPLNLSLAYLSDREMHAWPDTKAPM